MEFLCGRLLSCCYRQRLDAFGVPFNVISNGGSVKTMLMSDDH